VTANASNVTLGFRGSSRGDADRNTLGTNFQLWVDNNYVGQYNSSGPTCKIYYVPLTGAGNYTADGVMTVKVTGYTNDTNSAPEFTDFYVFSEITSVLSQIPLKVGWNLISIPVTV